MITRENIQEILEAARIEEVVGDFISIRKRGVNYIGLCPFHNEKTPSFTVSPAKGIYKCFGCGKAGGAVNFVMEHEHYAYPEALKYLAGKYNIEIEEEEQTPEQLQQLNERESLFTINTFARKYFSDNLFKSEDGKAKALSYLKQRGFREEVIKKFQLGYCSEDRDAFTRNAGQNGYKPEYLEKTGLTIIKDNDQIDRFRGRVIFPIHNLTGKVIGFGGRTLSADPSKAKYVNSPESDIYNKSKSLYGVFLSKNSIVSKDDCYLVEGYTDVISLYQSGIENVVASSGTSLTEDQIKLIKRFTQNITILYDGDEAGLKASFRGTDLILEQGMNVRIVMFPEGEDPDSYVKNHRTAEVEDFIKSNAKDFISFKASLLNREAENDPIKKGKVVKEMVSTIALVPDGIFRNYYVKECSVVMDVPEQTLVNELNRILRSRFREKLRIPSEEMPPEPTGYQVEQQTEIDTTTTEHHERDIIRLLLNYAGDEIIFEEIDQHKRKKEVPVRVVDFITSDILNDEIRFQNSTYQKIFDEFTRSDGNDEIPDEKYFISHSDSVIASTAIDLLTSPYTLSINWSRNKIHVKTEKDVLKLAVTSSVLSFKAKKVDNMILENQRALVETGSDEDRAILLQKHVSLKKISMEINRQLSRIITK